MKTAYPENYQKKFEFPFRVDNINTSNVNVGDYYLERVHPYSIIVGTITEVGGNSFQYKGCKRSFFLPITSHPRINRISFEDMKGFVFHKTKGDKKPTIIASSRSRRADNLTLGLLLREMV